MTVVVIGAGVIGLAVSDALARRGATVTILEMRAPGRGASAASAGILAPNTEAHGDTPLLQMGQRSLQMYDDFITAAREHSGRQIEYARTGTFEVAMSEDDVGRLQAVKAWLDTQSVRTEWLSGADARSFELALSPNVIGGLFISAHGFVGVSSLVSALLQSARFAGAVLESPVEAIEVVPGNSRVDVRAGDRRYRADHVVVAAGSWTKRVRVEGLPALPVRPVRGQLLHLRWTKSPRPVRVVWSHDCYAVPWSDESLLVGATVEEVGFDESTTVAGVQSLTSAVSAVLPGAAGAALIEARAGLRPATPDGLPFIGHSDRVPSVTFATGHYRNGILLAPLTAAMVESALLDGKSDAMMAWTAPGRSVS